MNTEEYTIIVNHYIDVLQSVDMLIGVLLIKISNNDKVLAIDGKQINNHNCKSNLPFSHISYIIPIRARDSNNKEFRPILKHWHIIISVVMLASTDDTL